SETSLTCEPYLSQTRDRDVPPTQRKQPYITPLGHCRPDGRSHFEDERSDPTSDQLGRGREADGTGTDHDDRQFCEREISHWEPPRRWGPTWSSALGNSSLRRGRDRR